MGGAADEERYLLHDEIASGGMGTVHLGRLRGSAGFHRIVAIKRLHPMLAKEPEFRTMFLDEARLAGRIHHPNVVPTLDVIDSDGEILIVMEYVRGESLMALGRSMVAREQRIRPAIASAVMSGVLYGLHAAHEATNELREPLGLVHRDVSPQNVLVGVDGVPRVVDFGVAKATGRLHTTTNGSLKGKLAYMPPEQLHGQRLDRRADIYAAGVVLWETLTGERLFLGENEPDTMSRVLLGGAPPPSSKVPGLSPALDNVVLRALSRAPSDRFSTAREMSAALIEACPAAPPHEVGEWVEASAYDSLSRRAARIAELESDIVPAPLPPSVVQSHPSSSSVSSSIAVDRPAARRANGGAISAALAVVGLLAGAYFLGGRRAPERVASSSAAVAPLAPAAPKDPAAAVDASTPPSPAASGSAFAAPASAVSATPSSSSSAPRPAGHQVDCDPPYRRSAQGTKVWKRECLQ